MPTPAPRGRTATKPPVEPDLVEEEDDEFEDVEDDDLEELEEEPEAPAPKPKARKAAAPKAEGDKPKRQPPVRPAIEFGSPWLAAHVTEVTGDTYDARAIRMLLRKLAKDGKLDREIGETRERYQFSGPDDATVVLVVEMVKSGAAKELKQAGLQAVKDKAAATKAAKLAERAKAAAEDEEMGDFEDDDVEEAPAPAPRRRPAAKSAAPAKATPATTRRKTATAAK